MSPLSWRFLFLLHGLLFFDGSRSVMAPLVLLPWLRLVGVVWTVSPLSWRFLFLFHGLLFNRSRLLMAIMLLPWVRLVLGSRAPLVVAGLLHVLGVGVV